MHIQTHVLSGWCVANAFPLTACERLFAMLAASLADLDGIGIFIDSEYYMRWHHVASHNLIWAVVLSVLLTIWSKHRRGAFFLYLGLFHLHLVMDYFGSGPGWGINYLWPFSKMEVINPRAWNFYSWQNITTFCFSLVWTVVIFFWKKRTPLECLAPSLERRLVLLVTRRKAAHGRSSPAAIDGDL